MMLGDGVPRSPLYLYYRDRQEDGTIATQDAGASMLGLCKALAQWGCCAEADDPYDVSRYATAPTPAMDLAASRARAQTYYQIKATGAALLQGIWAALVAETPVLIALQVYPSFESVGASGRVPMPQHGEGVLGGHAIVAVANYVDASAPGGGYIGCRNSWAESWGDHGVAWLPYSYFTAGIVQEGWTLAVATAPTPTSDARTEMAGICVEVQRIITAAQQTGWSTPQVQSDLGACWDYQAQLTALVEQTPLSWQSQGTVKEYTAECQRLIESAQQNGWTSAGVRSQLGSIKDYQNDILALLGPPSPPDPTPTPSPQFVAPIPPGAIFGLDKWMLDGTGALAGHSLGCDMFCIRGTPVMAPADAVIEEVIGGTGLSGGAEIILSLADKSWAWRFRHVAAAVSVGQRVQQGQQIATVLDPSLDMLCAAPTLGYPDRWQHLDLSVCKGTDRFAPLGGGGGNYRASQWLAEIGCHGQQIARTPGPPSCGMAEHEASAFLLPFGRVAATLIP